MKSNFRLQYQLISNITGETFSIGDTVKLETDNPHRVFCGTIESFPSGCVKIKDKTEHLINITNILNMLKVSRRVYVLMEMENRRSSYCQYDVMGVAISKDKAIEWVSRNQEVRMYKETKELLY